MSKHPETALASTADSGLRERIRQLEALNSFHEEILKVIRIYSSSESFTAERCLQEVVNFLHKKFDIYLASILLLDDISKELILYVCAGDEALKPIVKTFRIRVGEGLTGEAARTGETITSHDVDADARYIRGPLVRTKSEIVIPIKSKNRIIGVLNLEDINKGRFTRDLASILEHVAMNIGFLLENKKLVDDLKSYSEQLEKKVEEKVTELARSEERYRAIVDNAGYPIFTTDVHGNITWSNRALAALTGHEPGEIIGLNLVRLIRKGHVHTMFTTLREVADGKEARGQQIEITTRKGEERTVEMTCLAIREDGTVTGVEFTLRDITDRMVIEKLRKNYMKSLEDAVKEQTSEIKDTQRAAILAIANLAESIDDDTGGHIQRIQLYTRIVAEELRKLTKYKDEITEEYVELIHDLSPLHDLGKVGIRDYILQKTDKLTEEEFERMKDHTVIGARALAMAGAMIHRESIFALGEMIAHHHHQKWDGSGYPSVKHPDGEIRSLRGEEIPLCARIVALADVYDALTSKRPYKMPFPHETTREMIVSQSGRHFDPEVVQAFLRREEDFVKVRNMFPDNISTQGKPFELPARDRV